MTNGIDRGRIEAAIGRHFDVSIPVDAGFVRGLNSGQIHVIEQPDSGGARAIAELAESLDPNLPHRRELDGARQRMLHPIRYRRYRKHRRTEHAGDRAA